MKKWYIVKRGAEIIEETFDNEKDAIRKAHLLTCNTGKVWRAEMVIGWDD